MVKKREVPGDSDDTSSVDHSYTDGSNRVGSKMDGSNTGPSNDPSSHPLNDRPDHRTDRAAAEAKASPAPPPSADSAGDAARPTEYGGRNGPDPTRYGDWEKNGRCIDF